MRLVLPMLLILIGCSDGKICYPSPIIGQEDMCHTEAEWKVISDKNWADISCMNRDDNGNGLTEKQYKDALKRCNLKEGQWYSVKDLK